MKFHNNNSSSTDSDSGSSSGSESESKILDHASIVDGSDDELQRPAVIGHSNKPTVVVVTTLSNNKRRRGEHKVSNTTTSVYHCPHTLDEDAHTILRRETGFLEYDVENALSNEAKSRTKIIEELLERRFFKHASGRQGGMSIDECWFYHITYFEVDPDLDIDESDSESSSQMMTDDSESESDSCSSKRPRKDRNESSESESESSDESESDLDEREQRDLDSAIAASLMDQANEDIRVEIVPFDASIPFQEPDESSIKNDQPRVVPIPGPFDPLPSRLSAVFLTNRPIWRVKFNFGSWSQLHTGAKLLSIYKNNDRHIEVKLEYDNAYDFYFDLDSALEGHHDDTTLDKLKAIEMYARQIKLDKMRK